MPGSSKSSGESGGDTAAMLAGCNCPNPPGCNISVCCSTVCLLVSAYSVVFISEKPVPGALCANGGAVASDKYARFVCTNEQCPEVPYLHKECADNLEHYLVAHVIPHLNTRRFNSYKEVSALVERISAATEHFVALQSFFYTGMWERQVYTKLPHQNIKCRCGRGRLRRLVAEEKAAQAAVVCSMLSALHSRLIYDNNSKMCRLLHLHRLSQMRPRVKSQS